MSPDERTHVAQDGRIHVTCEFCNRRYEFGAADFGSA
jgi:redox-regulated HSP33 family molecular chaperone